MQNVQQVGTPLTNFACCIYTPAMQVVLQPITEGRDLIGRAKTGSGKTLAFALPVVENLLEEDRVNKPQRGRGPRCIVLTPTRELCNQVSRRALLQSMWAVFLPGGPLSLKDAVWIDRWDMLMVGVSM